MPDGPHATTSVTAAQVMGDCLAIALLERRGFRAEDFRFLHPGGVIGGVASRPRGRAHARGRRDPARLDHGLAAGVMLEIMASGSGSPRCRWRRDPARVVSDGDFKRILVKHADPWSLKAKDVMSRRPSTIGKDALVATAVRTMEGKERKARSPRSWWSTTASADRGAALHDCL
jgi:arabinose-5-phosphate isomerase